MTQVQAYSRDAVASAEGAFFRRVYNWMVVGLALTGGIAYLASQSDALINLIFGNRILFYILAFGEIGMVFYLAARIQRLSPGTASAMFLIYSGLNGLVFSVLFRVYAGADITMAFLVTSGTFAAMSVYGYTTRRSLASWGSFLFMGLIGIIIASLVNFFVHSEMLYWIVTYAGVLIFTGLTAYDTQRLRVIFANGFQNEGEETKSAIMGALALYLDFINLFLMLLRIFGGSRD
jgi:hypothetical protein